MVLSRSFAAWRATFLTASRCNRVLAYAVFTLTLATNLLVWPIPDLGFDYNTRTFEIDAIDPGTAAWHVLQLGDRIVGVHGQGALQFMLRVDRFAELSPGERTLPITLQRAGRLFTVELPLAPPSPTLQLSKLAYGLLALVCWVSGYFLGVVRADEMPGTPLLATFWLTLSGVIGCFHFAILASEPLLLGLLWLTSTLLAPLAIYIHVRFPPRSTDETNKLAIIKMCLLAGSILTNIGILTQVRFTQQSFLALEDLFWQLIPVSIIMALASSGWILYRAYHQNQFPYTQRQIRFLAIICASTALLWILLWLIPVLILQETIVRTRWLALPVGAIPLAYLLGSHAPYLNRIERVVRRLFVHLVTATLLTFVLAVLAAQLNLHRVSDTLWLAVAFVLPYRALQHAILQLLPRGFRPDNQHALEAAIQDLTAALAASQVVDIVVAGVRAQFGQPALAFYEAASGPDQTLRLTTQDRMADLPTSVPAGPLMDLLLAGSSVLDSHAVRQRLHNAPLTHDERLLLNEPGLMLLCPIRRSTAPASLLGLLLLGMRADLDAYHADDQRGLQRLAAAATLAVAREAEAVARARLEAQHRAAQHANDQLRAYAAQAQELAAANERNRIAREIHDGLGHYLTMVTWQLKGARKVFDTDPPSARESIEEAYASARDALREIQRSVATLREAPDHSHPPLLETLEALIEKNRSMCAGITFTTTGTPRPVPGPTSDALYRAVQEGLTNVRKHAEGAQVTVHLDYTRPQQVRLVIQDNGPGTTNLDGGYGLVGIRERIAQVSGTVVTETAPGQGFRLMIEVPA